MTSLIRPIFSSFIFLVAFISFDADAMGKTRADKKRARDQGGQVSIDSNGNKSCDLGAKYTVKKGQDSFSKSGLSDIYSRAKKKDGAFEFRVCFDATANYELENQGDQYDWNKLYGFSDCGSVHHKNSARVVWRWNKVTQRIDLAAYVYVDRERSDTILGSIDPYEIVDLKIRSDGNTYIFDLKGQSVVMPRGCNRKVLKGYRLFPFFGGTSRAPHDVSVWVDEY